MRVERVTEGVVLVHGDNKDVLPRLSDIDMVLTDPPWSAYVHENAKSTKRGEDRLTPGDSYAADIDFAPVTADALVDMVGAWCELAARWVVFTCDWMFMPALADAGLLVRFGVGVKTNPHPQLSKDRPSSGWESVAICHRPAKHKRWNGCKLPRHYLCGKAHAAVWTMPQPKSDRIHPTQKAVEFYDALLSDFGEKGSIVLDPFMGSGSTGIAAVRGGFRYIGIEKDEKYFNHALRRVRDAAFGQMRLAD